MKSRDVDVVLGQIRELDLSDPHTLVVLEFKQPLPTETIHQLVDQLREMLAAGGHENRVICVDNGLSITTLSDSQLAELGLQRAA